MPRIYSRVGRRPNGSFGVDRMGDDAQPAAKKWTRRDWLRVSSAFGAGAAAGAFGAYSVGRLLGAPLVGRGEVRDTVYYPTRGDPSGPQWWDRLLGLPVRVSDFGEWQGAPGIWRGLFNENGWVSGTGLPVLIVRVKRDDSVFQAPSDVSLPPGFSLFYDDASRDIRIVVLYSRCTHLCCYPTWHLAPIPAAFRNYIVEPGTVRLGQDPIWCICHDAMFDPMTLVHDVHPGGAGYVGARHVRGPAPRGLPLVPVRAEGDVLVGVMADPRWYTSYCV